MYDPPYDIISHLGGYQRAAINKFFFLFLFIYIRIFNSEFSLSLESTLNDNRVRQIAFPCSLSKPSMFPCRQIFFQPGQFGGKGGREGEREREREGEREDTEDCFRLRTDNAHLAVTP